MLNLHLEKNHFQSLHQILREPRIQHPVVDKGLLTFFGFFTAATNMEARLVLNGIFNGMVLCFIVGSFLPSAAGNAWK